MKMDRGIEIVQDESDQADNGQQLPKEKQESDSNAATSWIDWELHLG